MTLSHDTIVFRLAQMLVKLNQGAKLDPADMAAEFGVTLRTVQRDLNERFAYLPLQRANGKYYLDPLFLGKLSTRDIERFASLAGVKGLFPSLNDDFLREIFDANLQSAFLVKGHDYEDLGDRKAQFSELEAAIVAHQRITFQYRKGDSDKTYCDANPYTLINEKGIWYLAAWHDGKLKTFAFTRMREVRAEAARFAPDPALLQQIKSQDGIWFSDAQIEIVLKVSRDIAGYFKRRKLIANQVIEKELDDGGLILAAKVGHLNQVVPIVRYWIPHLRIISPEGLQGEVELALLNYLSK